MRPAGAVSARAIEKQAGIINSAKAGAVKKRGDLFIKKAIMRHPRRYQRGSNPELSEALTADGLFWFLQTFFAIAKNGQF